MRVKMDDQHYLNSDQYCYWISVEYEAKKKDGTPYTVERRCSGYVRTFAEAVESYIEKRLGGAEIADFKALAQEIEKIKKTVKDWKCAVERKQ